jgi:hypothetical protein
MAKAIIDKPDYSLSIRYRKWHGQWTEWINRGQGKFISIEVVQSQIRILAKAYAGREKEVRFERNGKLCDWFGNESNEVIKLPSR